jgi:hypothetical protein
MPGEAHAMPVAPVSSASNRGRWIVAGGVVGAAIVLTVGAFVLFGGPAAPEALKYIPDDAAIVAELRLDLPGDQMQKAGNLLAHFPGFLDQALLPDKLDEAFSRMVTEASDGTADYRTDIKPWLNGPAFIGLIAPEAGPGALQGLDPKAQLRHAVLSATTNGAVSCETTFAGQSVSHRQHGAFDLTISADGAFACVVDGRQALLGDPETVGLALDAKAAGTGMDRSDRYRAARAALGGDRIATVFVNGAAVADLMPQASGLPIPALDLFAPAVPDWTMAGVRAEDDALVVDTVAAPAPAVPAASAAASAGSLLPLPATHPSVIAGLVPADTLLLVENQGAGIGIQNVLARMRSVPELSAPMSMLDGAGGAGPLVGWIDDAGVAVSLSGQDPRIAAILVAADEAAAKARVTQLTGLLSLAALQGGATLETSEVAGVTITTVSIADLGALVPSGSVPGAGEIPSTGAISFSIAGHGRSVLIGSSPAAVAGILGVQPGQSLADQAAFKLATQRGLSGSRTSVYAAAGSAVDLVKTFLSADDQAEWNEYAPYLEPIEAVGVTTTSDAAANRSRIVITVTTTQPSQ